MSGIDEVGHREVPPDPSIADAVGRHHSLPTAIADLVDNSIDADAARVHIRFMAENGFVKALRIIDDGRGMDVATIDRAMTFGGRREYGADELGHFGLGLKAASLSQADQLDVYSYAQGGVSPVGRRIHSSRSTRVAELDPQQVSEVLSAPAAQIHGLPRTHGTVVEWSEVRTFLSSPSTEERTAWIDDTIESLRSHLGLVFHRILARGDIQITIDEYDVGLAMPGIVRRVEAIDPLPAQTIPSSRPLRLHAQLDGGVIRLDAYLWPDVQRSATGYRLFGLPGSRFQGFYMYRHDRLLQIGGWNGTAHGGRALEFARVVLDLDENTVRHVTINPEKSGVEFDADLRAVIAEAAADNGTTFRDFLDEAQRRSVLSRRRQRQPVTISEVSRGLSPDLRETLAETFTHSEHGSIEIRWKTMRGGTFVEVDLERRTLWLNSQHRRALGSDAGEADDLPLLKALLLLLYSRFFEGAMLGAREKDELRAWEELIDAALDEELERRSYGGGPSDVR